MHRDIRSNRPAPRRKNELKSASRLGAAKRKSAFLIHSPEGTDARTSFFSFEPSQAGHVSASLAQVEAVSQHPLADLIGKYDGEIWEEIFEGIERDRQKDTAALQDQSSGVDGVSP